VILNIETIQFLWLLCTERTDFLVNNNCYPCMLVSAQDGTNCKI